MNILSFLSVWYETLNLKRWTKCLLLFLGFCVVLPVFAASDPYEGLISDTIAPVFGEGSTVQKVILLVEILAAAGIYIKTKNLMAMLGVIVVSIFLNYGINTFVTEAN